MPPFAACTSVAVGVLLIVDGTGAFSIPSSGPVAREVKLYNSKLVDSVLHDAYERALPLLNDDYEWNVHDASDEGPHAMHSAASSNGNNYYGVQLSEQEFLHHMDYRHQLNALHDLLESTAQQLEEIRLLAKIIKEMELEDPHLSQLNDEDGKGLKRALSQAKTAADVYGMDSNQARRAWKQVQGCVEELEECNVDDDDDNAGDSFRYKEAALKAHHYYNAVMDAPLLEKGMEGVDALMHLRKFVEVEKRRLDNSDNEDIGLEP